MFNVKHGHSDYAALKLAIETLLPEEGPGLAPFLASLLEIEPTGEDLDG